MPAGLRASAGWDEVAAVAAALSKRTRGIGGAPPLLLEITLQVVVNEGPSSRGPPPPGDPGIVLEWRCGICWSFNADVSHGEEALRGQKISFFSPGLRRFTWLAVAMAGGRTPGKPGGREGEREREWETALGRQKKLRKGETMNKDGPSTLCTLGGREIKRMKKEDEAKSGNENCVLVPGVNG